MLTEYKLPDGSDPPVKIEFGYDEPEYEVIGLTFRQKFALKRIIWKAWLKRVLGLDRD